LLEGGPLPASASRVRTAPIEALDLASFTIQNNRLRVNETAAPLATAIMSSMTRTSRAMAQAIVGVIGNAHIVENRFPAQICGEKNLRAVAEVAGALPLVFAGNPDITDVGALLDVVDGVLLTGARANVHPTRFRAEPN